MKNKNIIFCFLLLNIISCVKDNEKTNVINKYDTIIKFLEKNRIEICEKNYYKEIIALRLIDEQKEFYHFRLTYFIDILKGDETNKKQYYSKHYNYMIKFPYESLSLFYSSKDMFDYWLLDIIEKEFNDIKLPINYLKEYFMDYRAMINQDYMR
jgi:hypothetical protein